MNEISYIYVLVDPDSYEGEDITEIKYVGLSLNPKKRFNRHIHEANRGDKNLKCEWIRSLLNVNKKPILIILFESTIDEVATLELKVIEDFNQCYDLTNIKTKGNCVISKEGRKRISDAAKKARLNEIKSGKTLAFHTQEAREKISKKLKNYKHSEESKQNFSKGAKKRFQNQSERDKISQATKGKEKTIEHKKKLSEASKRNYNNLPDDICPICGFKNKKPIVAMHRKNKGH